MVQYLILIVRYEWEFLLEANTELLSRPMLQVSLCAFRNNSCLFTAA